MHRLAFLSDKNGRNSVAKQFLLVTLESSMNYIVA